MREGVGVELVTCTCTAWLCRWDSTAPGLGTVWGRQLATSMLADAGFGDVAVREIETDPINFYYVAHK